MPFSFTPDQIEFAVQWLGGMIAGAIVALLTRIGLVKIRSSKDV